MQELSKGTINHKGEIMPVTAVKREYHQAITHYCSPKNTMKSKGFSSQKIKCVHIQPMSTGKFCVFLTSDHAREKSGYAVFETLEMLLGAFYFFTREEYLLNKARQFTVTDILMQNSEASA